MSYHAFSDGDLSSWFAQIGSMLNYTQPNSEVINIIGFVHNHLSNYTADIIPLTF